MSQGIESSSRASSLTEWMPHSDGRSPGHSDWICFKGIPTDMNVLICTHIWHVCCIMHISYIYMPFIILQQVKGFGTSCNPSLHVHQCLTPCVWWEKHWLRCPRWWVPTNGYLSAAPWTGFGMAKFAVSIHWKTLFHPGTKHHSPTCGQWFFHWYHVRWVVGLGANLKQPPGPCFTIETPKVGRWMPRAAWCSCFMWGVSSNGDPENYAFQY